jgi:hypothetical protein
MSARGSIDRVDLWYAAYGSNMCGERFECYVAGGCPPGATRTYPGARDRTLPDSPTWGGGIAFYDPDAPGESIGVAYGLTLGQFSDVAAQEMHREPGADLDLAALWHTGSHLLGPGRYESLHVVGRLDDLPVVTFTASTPPPLNPPVPAYVATMARGITETHGWGVDETVDYLLARPGIDGGWDVNRLRSLLAVPDHG